MEDYIRQALFLLIGFAFGAFGALVNYTFFKKQKDQDLTLQGCLKAVILGGATGLIIWLWNDGGSTLGHMVFAGIAFWAGLGSETFIGKIIGSVQAGQVPVPDPAEPKVSPEVVLKKLEDSLKP